MDNQQGLTRSFTEGTLLSVTWLPRWVWRRMDTCVYIWLSPYTAHPKLRNIVNRLYPDTKQSLKFKKQNLLPNTGLTTAPSSSGEIRCQLTCHPHEPTPFLRGPSLDSSKKAWVNLYLGQESISIQTHLPKSACPLGSHRRTKSLSQGFPSII